MGHTDVVGVQREKWTVDPFAAVHKEGYIYGRGAVDDKDNLAASPMVMLLLKRHDIKLDRDVIFLAESGEEGFNDAGMKHVIAKHWNEIDCEFCWPKGAAGCSRRASREWCNRHHRKSGPRRAAGRAWHQRPRLGPPARQRDRAAGGGGGQDRRLAVAHAAE